MSKIYLETLDPARQNIFTKLAVFQSAYLAGGTALTLQIKHRISEDFDVFSPQPLDRAQLLTQVKKIATFQIMLDLENQVTLVSGQGIKLDFVHHPYKLIKPLVQTKSIPLASITDIAADKASTIGRRATWRDYVDIFYLLKTKHLSLTTIIETAKKRFKGAFNEALFLEQLVYFKDLEMTTIDFLEPSYTEKEIKSSLETQVNQFLKQTIKKE